MYNHSSPGPTLRLKPGDTLRVHLKNELGPNPSDDPEADDTHYPLTDVFNIVRHPNTTNFHTHGLHVASSDVGAGCKRQAAPNERMPVLSEDCEYGDNALLAVGPGQTATYNIPIVANHHAGTNWYHPHAHGSTSLQLGGGMLGMLIIEDPPTLQSALACAGVLEELPLVVSQYYFSGTKAASTSYKVGTNSYNVIATVSQDATAQQLNGNLDMFYRNCELHGAGGGLQGDCSPDDECQTCGQVACQGPESGPGRCLWSNTLKVCFDASWLPESAAKPTLDTSAACSSVTSADACESRSALCSWDEKGKPPTCSERTADAMCDNSNALLEIAVNGQFVPHTTMIEGEWQRWRIVAGGYDNALYLNFPHCEFVVLGFDGIYLDEPRPYGADVAMKDRYVFIPQGGRADLLIKCYADSEVYAQARTPPYS